MVLSESVLIFDVSSDRSKVRICETLIAGGFGRLESDYVKRKLPGASAKATFEVTIATITVAMWLWLNGLDWITSTGRRCAGPEPTGSGSDAHQSSPRFMFHGNKLRLDQHWLQAGLFAGVHFVKPCRNCFTTVPRQMFS